jgi:hypothetical protein
VESPQSWTSFLQNLPVSEGPILDYRGRKIADQEKHFAIVNYDVGHSDLQQCADALIRLRSEWLFAQKLFDRIGFHFVNGRYYSWNEYCRGWKPVMRNSKLQMVKGKPDDRSHRSLRNYLDIVYTYASTISLARELKDAKDYETGTVVISAGSPGHCFIIVDESKDASGKKVFKLVEGYMPAQSIYVLRNMESAAPSPWHHLSHGVIRTASYTFSNYQLKKFE